MKSHIQESMVNSYGKFFVVNFRHLVKNIFWKEYCVTNSLFWNTKLSEKKFFFG
jgi:hypothetical protein